MQAEIVPFAQIDRDEWDAFCRESDSAWYFHTAERIAYALDMAPEERRRSTNHSFALRDGSTFLAIVPLVAEIDAHGHSQITYAGLNTPYPAFVNGITARVQKQLTRYIFQAVFALPHIRYVNYFVTPLTEAVLQRDLCVNPLPAFGFHDTSLSTNILALAGKTEHELFSGFRKGTKSDIKTAERNGYRVTVVDAGGIDREVFARYRDIHFHAAGRQTRPDSTWEAMYQRIKSGRALLALCRNAQHSAAAVLVTTYKQKALYASAATRPEFGGERGIGHLLQWAIIRQLVRQGYTHYELGWNWSPNISQEVADAKMLGISRFKAGFGSRTYPLFRGERCFAEEYMRALVSERITEYFRLLDKDGDGTVAG